MKCSTAVSSRNEADESLELRAKKKRRQSRPRRPSRDERTEAAPAKLAACSRLHHQRNGAPHAGIEALLCLSQTRSRDAQADAAARSASLAHRRIPTPATAYNCLKVICARQINDLLRSLFTTRQASGEQSRRKKPVDGSGGQMKSDVADSRSMVRIRRP